MNEYSNKGFGKLLLNKSYERAKLLDINKVTLQSLEISYNFFKKQEFIEEFMIFDRTTNMYKIILINIIF